MAHRTNVTPVGIGFKTEDQPDAVVDPVCKSKISRKTCRYMLFDHETTYYFCSKECQTKFRSPTGPLPQAA